MMKLTVLRHAKSSWDDPGLDDFNRPLNAVGRKAARRMGRELKLRKMHFDLVLASAAARVRETIDGIEENYDFKAKVSFEQSIYTASEEALLSLVRSLPKNVHFPLFVGHNPGLERLLLMLTHDDEQSFRRRVAHKFPTGALAVVKLPADDWDKVELGSAKIAALIYPKELT